MLDDSQLYFTNSPALLALAPYSTLAHWRSEGRGPAFIKLGSRVAYSGRDLNDWIARQRVEPVKGQAPACVGRIPGDPHPAAA